MLIFLDYHITERLLTIQLVLLVSTSRF